MIVLFIPQSTFALIRRGFNQFKRLFGGSDCSAATSGFMSAINIGADASFDNVEPLNIRIANSPTPAFG
jgi:hypothetical protein